VTLAGNSRGEETNSSSGGDESAALEASTIPSISVVIPTYNRCERLGRVLDALATPGTSEHEVVVISDGSSDGTEEYLRHVEVPFPLRWETQANQGPAAARNRGVAIARAPIVLFLDDDVIPDPALVSVHVAAHVERGPSTVIIGPMLNPVDHVMKPWVRWEQRMLYKQYDALRDGRYEPMFRQFYTGNASIRRDEVLEAGGFDTRYRRAEDLELGIRLWERGVRFVFEPGARGYHYADRSFEAWRDIARVYGRFEVEFARHPGREWQWEFLSYSYRSRHIGLRALVQIALRTPRLTEAVVSRSARMIQWLDRGVLDRVGQWMLSAIYAIDYWRSTADALGGRDQLRVLVRRHVNSDL
jgi:GT2 family glycosyltransferase